MTTTAPWALDALEALMSEPARRMGSGAWAAQPGGNPIRLTGGIPDPNTLPVEQLLEATRVVLAREAAPALEYGGNAGYEGLRELIASRVCAEEGCSMTAENISIVSGSAHGLHNVFETFVNPGDVVVLDSPAWGGAIRTLRPLGAEFASMPWDEDGPIIETLVETLEQVVASGRRPKLIYTIPTFQNPLGVTQTLERRLALLDVAARYRMLIVEDDPYGELRFSGSPVPSLFNLSGGEGVIKCGTFSKVIATGLRVGWLQGQKEYIDATLRMRFDNGTSPFTSRIIAAFIESDGLEPHVERMREVYRAKCDAMLSTLSETCAGKVEWTTPEGGFFVWMTLPESIQLPALMRAANEEGVAVIPGPGFYADGGGQHNVRLCFSNVEEQEIVEAIRRLARAVDRAGS